MPARLIATILMILGLAFPAQAQSTRVLDDFEDLTPWSANASTDVTSVLSSVPGREGRAMRLDYDFNDRSGYAFAARLIEFEAPENYEITFWVRGQGQTNTFEIKFTDETAENVHWRQVTRYDFPNDWTLFTIRPRQITWAWGPDPDRVFRRAERMEFVVVAAEGGAGFVEIDQLTLRTLPPEPAVPPQPVPTASSQDGNFTAIQAVDGDGSTFWRTQGAGEERLTLDLGYQREFGGLTLRWVENRHASAYRVMGSFDGREWVELASVQDGNGGTDWLRLPEASARWLRLDLLRPATLQDSNAGQMGAGQMLGGQAAAPAYALAEIEIEPLSFGETDTTFLTAIADESRRGLYPRGFHGEQPYWTLVGVDGGGESGLIGEDGAIELRRGGPSVEPFVIDNGRVIGWADVAIEQSLADGDLPVPSVTWTHDDWTLKTTAFAEGAPADARLHGRYDLTNTSTRPIAVTLALMARPMQVNGPVQFLAVPGGASPIQRMDWDGRTLTLNETVGIMPLVAPTGAGVSTFQSGADPQSLLGTARTRAGDRPWTQVDATGLMAGTVTYDIRLQPGQTATLGFVSALSGELVPMVSTDAVALLDAAQTRVAADWRAKVDRFDLIVPEEGRRIADSMKSAVAHMLMSRQGPRIQPGTRSYNRSWIRDGAMQAEGLNRVGHPQIGADYLRWYAPYLFSDGKVPCCVDDRGADPVPENDSHGQFIFLAADTWRYTQDEALLRSVWPQVQGAIAYMDQLRAQTRTPEYQTPETRHMYGLLPASISHEGYADRPAYSYWDDFWGLKGYKDAIVIAEALGETEAAERFAVSLAEFQADVMTSITGTALHHGIDWIAGAADRGDFDATSTTIGLSPAGLQADLPQGLLVQTFEKYWNNFEARLANRAAWRDYTPYELRNVGALTRLGQRERAMAALDFFFADQRPRAWNGWAEVVGRHLREPRFIGDMPHAWISSDYIRSALDMFVYQRDADLALVLAAGLPHAWMNTETGVGVRDVRTPWGRLSYHIRRERGALVLTMDGDSAPPGAYVLAWPDDVARPADVRIDGRRVAWTQGDLPIPIGTRRIEFR